jgi:outer membrane protein, heavy metal efflux system
VRVRVRGTVCAIAMAGTAVTARAQEPLTLEAALALARERSPRVVAARARVAEAQARLKGATPLFRENPVLEWSQGPRTSPSGDTQDRDLALSQALDWPHARSARVDSAKAEVEREAAASQDVLRQTLRDVAAAYLDAVRSEARLRQAEAEQAIAEELAQIARRRHASGDVAALDVNVSEGAHARAKAEVREGQAVRTDALATLQNLLGLPAAQPIRVAGLGPDERPAVDLQAALEQRPDVRALVHAAAQADSDLRLGRALAWPQLGLTVRHEREQADNILMGGVTVTLPLFDRGQAVRAEAEARAARLRGELEALRRRAAVEAAAAMTAYEHRRAAVHELQATALPLLEDNERLARRSYEEGEMGLGDVLLIRRETIETRRALLDQEHAAALARIDVLFATGALR